MCISEGANATPAIDGQLKWRTSDRNLSAPLRLHLQLRSRSRQSSHVNIQSCFAVLFPCEAYDYQMDISERSTVARRKENNRTAAGSRRYRSKAERPCDLCRSRKVLCNIPDPSKPCQLCDRTSRPCTFTVGPGKQLRVNGREDLSRDVAPHQINELEAPEQNDGGHFTPSFNNTDLLETPSEFLPSFGQLFGSTGSGTPLETQWQNAVGSLDDGLDVQSAGINEGLPDMHMPELWATDDIEPSIANSGSPATRSSAAPSIPSPMAHGDSSLNCMPHMSSIFIGYSNESDSFLLENYPYNSSDELDFFMVRYRRPSQHKVSGGWPPVHILQSKAQSVSEGQEAMQRCLALEDERTLLKELVDVETGVSLLRL